MGISLRPQRRRRACSLSKLLIHLPLVATNAIAVAPRLAIGERIAANHILPVTHAVWQRCASVIRELFAEGDDASAARGRSMKIRKAAISASTS